MLPRMYDMPSPSHYYLFSQSISVKIHVSSYALYPTISEFVPRVKVCLIFINLIFLKKKIAFRRLVKLPSLPEIFLHSNTFHCVQFWYGSWNSSDTDITRPQAGRPSSLCSIPGKGKDFLPSVHTGFGGSQTPVQ